MQKRKIVVLLIETTHGYGRGLLRGIAKYSKLHGPWSFYREMPFYGHSKQIKHYFSKLEKINASGAIIREPTPRQVEHFIKLGIPLIISPNLINPQIPTILTDTKKIAQLAAEHLIGRGFKNFAYCGFKEMQWSKDRYENFTQEIKRKNYQVNQFFATVNKLINPKEKDFADIVRWLHSLPKPVGLMACNDDMGRIVLDTCKLAGFHVPEQIAVLGVDDDELTCELTDPPLSSIALHAEKTGYEAAKLLDSLMVGEKMNGQIIHQEPSHVVIRQSTDVMAIEDNDVAQAIRYIHQHNKEPITVEDVAHEVNLSRRHLYKKFMTTMGHSVFDEIKKNRINHICELLTETDWSIYKITMSLGFTGIEHIARYFQKEMGMAPNEYRKKFKR
jgi:LacI family transcriptional regulator